VRLRGTGVAAGIAAGPALLLEKERAQVFRLRLAPEGVGAEIARLEVAVESTRAQLGEIRDRLESSLGTPHSYIFEAQLLMLDDPLLVGRVVAVIEEQRVNAEWALREVGSRLRELFEGLGDSSIAERRTDIDDVIGRIQSNLYGNPDEVPSLSRLPEEVVLVAAELPPSQAAELDWPRVLAVVTDAGSQTHHTAILARSLGVPAVVGTGDASRRIPGGAFVVVDGTLGEVVVGADEEELARYRARAREEREESVRRQATRGLAAVTSDGVAVRLLANAEFIHEAEAARSLGAQGIGLFRSEYLLTRLRGWPDENQQVEVYERLLERMAPFPVTVRTWDVGAEQFGGSSPARANPALGERALRLLGRHPQPFLVQLRALLRAALKGPLRIAFPFIGGPSDLEVALDLLAAARESLVRDGIPFRSVVPVGLNIEVPSAALTVDLLGERVDFFSVGTNDLIQYLLAVDRSDPGVAALYQPLHPAVLRTLDAIARAAELAGIDLSVCGEMAADPLQALMLLGLGYRELSMGSAAIPVVKDALRRVSAEAAQRAARLCLGRGSAAEVEAILNTELAAALRPAHSLRE
jgi:phosphotransferase system enzyme I (PtsI)